MRDILRDLYYGNYAAFERTYSRESEQAKARGIVVDLEENAMNLGGKGTSAPAAILALFLC